MLPFIHAMHVGDNPVKRFYDNELFDRNVIKVIYEMTKHPSISDLYYIPAEYRGWRLSKIEVYVRSSMVDEYKDLGFSIGRASYDNTTDTFRLRILQDEMYIFDTTYCFASGKLDSKYELYFIMSDTDDLINVEELCLRLVKNGYEYHPRQCIVQ